MMDENMAQVLKDIGFTDYEAKAYLALLQESPLNGYTIAQRSGVPRSKIYEVLAGLVRNGDVLISCGEPVLYAPKPSADIIESRRAAFERHLKAAEQGLAEFESKKTPTDLLWDIHGRDEIFYRLREVIGRAESKLLLQIFEEDTAELYDSLEKAAQRGVEIFVIAYGNVDLPFAHVYSHEPGHAEITAEYGERWAILSIDGKEIVTGIVSMGRESRAAWSAHLGIVMPITEQIKHDLYIKVMLEKHRDILEASFGPALKNLRDQFGPSTTTYRPQ